MRSGLFFYSPVVIQSGASKPVSRVLSWTAIYLRDVLPRRFSHLPEDSRAGLKSSYAVLLRIEFAG